MKQLLKAILLPAVFLAGLIIGLPAGSSYTPPSKASGATSGVYRVTDDGKLDLPWLESAKESTVALYTPDGAGLGSGFIVARVGDFVYLMTAYHVVDQVKESVIIQGAFGDTDYRLPATIAKVDKDLDLALLKARDVLDKFKPLPLADQVPKDGSLVFAIGYPGPVYPPMITVGVLVHVEPGTDEWILHTRAARWFGMSGGPVLNKAGAVIGMVKALGNRGITPDSGHGFEVSVTKIKAFLEAK